MKSLTICYTTARKQPSIEWFFDSLKNQYKEDFQLKIIIVSYHVLDVSGIDYGKLPVPLYTHCKPNVWQGPHRLTKKEWWAKSAYLNTGLCLADTEWIAFCDDRSVLMPTWLKSVKDAIAGHYAVCGSYEKRTGMTVENGYIKHGGIIIGQDPRKTNSDQPRPVPGSYWFGCTNALPVEWMLQINGADESADSLGMEDVIMGCMLEANGFQIKYDPRMQMIEDRSPEFYESAVGRTDKNISPNDKSHGLLRRVSGKKTSTHHWDFRLIRTQLQKGIPFPIPDQPTHDWWDNQPLSEFP